jgi:hypothetical protein
MQLKHVPLCLFVVASICLAGAVTAAAKAPGEVADQSAERNQPGS